MVFFVTHGALARGQERLPWKIMSTPWIKKIDLVSKKAHQVHINSMRTKGAVTQGNFSCNLSRNFVATQVARNIA